MFETVAPEAFKTRSRIIFYETLPLSIAVHAIAIAAAIIATVWNVVFPVQSPRFVSAYSLVSLPDPPPPPPAAASAPKQQQLPKLPPPPPDKIVAPTVIPDTIPQIPDPPPPITPAAAPVVDASAAGPPGGGSDGSIGGEIGGIGYGVPGGITIPDDGRVHIERTQQLPLQVVSQDYPTYPDEARKKQLEDQVVVRYVIGKNGRVINVEILDHANQPMFDDATVAAIQQWRFRPMIKDGKPVEVVHELAVNFVLIRR